MLNLDPAWRLDSPGEAPREVMWKFSEIIGKVAAQGEDRQRILEHFKGYFANAAGQSCAWSSNESWAETDLDRYMENATKNAPLFIEAFYNACIGLHQKFPAFAVPDVTRINRALNESNSIYRIQPPDLVLIAEYQPSPAVEPVASFDEQAQKIIQDALRKSDQFLTEGHYRQAVQEILWLLETVSTAFQGIEIEGNAVEGKYFNKIAESLRNHQKGKMLDQVLGWITTLHGYLSSPTGGGVRHGVDLKKGIVIQANEAALLCNLIRSYIAFLLAEYDRLNRQAAA